MADDATLYERIGGRETVDALVETFYDRVLADESLEPYFEDADPAELEAHQKQFITYAAGGADEWNGRSMAEAHEHLDVTDAAFDRVTEHLDESLRTHDVAEADREELLDAVAALRNEVVTA
ncbi:group I truncated hemoglobin [Halomicrobium salinisoli]|uniref:group I truncated hemoglobin n=1 Tax=Halomicrobium salinisoli TaxID=2878391 RepID=UPI001CEFF5C3|nr:group 1 truncated hemoglobin [Halomicrobium salinisoli]